MKVNKITSKKQRMISVYIGEDIYQALRRYAFEKDTKYATLIRELLQKELKKKGYLSLGK